MIPLIRYRPPLPKSNKKESEDAQKAFREEFKAKGLDDSSITAIHSITRADRIDFQVNIPYHNCVGHLSDTLCLAYCSDCRSHRDDAHQQTWWDPYILARCARDSPVYRSYAWNYGRKTSRYSPASRKSLQRWTTPCFLKDFELENYCSDKRSRGTTL